MLDGRRVLIGVSGGIAAYKAAVLARLLVREGADVRVALTRGAREFVGAATFEGLTGNAVPGDVFDDAERIVHVELARWAQVAVFAPATANLVAKLAHGLADDLVTSTAACLTAPTIVAPAMHTEMWEHAATQANIALLRARGVRIVGPESGELAGGDVGPGRLVEPEVLVAAIRDALGADGPLAGRRVLVTAGPTHEPIDPVRYVANRSSGKMGYAVAEAAAARGALVDLIAGPTALPDPAGVTVHHVTTGREMRDRVLALADSADAIVKAAAVADFRPATTSEHKIKKDGEGLDSVPLERNPDILAELGARDHKAVLVGFAAETRDAVAYGRVKLAAKGADLFVVNDVSADDAGFGTDTNRAVILGADGSETDVPLTTKRALAEAILDRVAALLAR